MSSVYRVLCLSHDPAIHVARWENDDCEAAIAAALDPATREDLAEHERCDLMVGRYSAGFVEACCPARQGRLAHGRHIAPQWIDHKYLALLSAALDVADGPLATAVGEITRHGCWTEQRIRRLRIELGLEIPAAWRDVA